MSHIEYDRRERIAALGMSRVSGLDDDYKSAVAEVKSAEDALDMAKRRLSAIAGQLRLYNRLAAKKCPEYRELLERAL